MGVGDLIAPITFQKSSHLSVIAKLNRKNKPRKMKALKQELNAKLQFQGYSVKTEHVRRLKVIYTPLSS
jgi:hypothetical protein